MTPDIRKERETALYEAALRLIAKGVNPAAMKVQQIADEAGIGKGTVYEYFVSKDEILQGMALYCFDTEIARIAVLMEPCTTLQELEDAVMAYLQDLSGNRMGTYQVIASSIGARENLRGMDEWYGGAKNHGSPAAKGRSTPPCDGICLLSRTTAGGQTMFQPCGKKWRSKSPALPDDYCDLVLLHRALRGKAPPLCGGWFAVSDWRRAVLCFQAPGRANAHTKPARVDPPRTEPINKQK